MMSKLLPIIQEIINRNDFDMAIAILNKAIDKCPDDNELYWLLGLIYLLQEDELQAQEIWLSVLLKQDTEQVVAITQELLNFLEGQVEENIKNKKLGYAKIIYESMVAFDPHYTNQPLTESLITTLYEFGNYLRVEKDYETAVNVYGELLSICPQHADAWRALANCYLNLQNYNQAEEAIRQSIELTETDLTTNYQLLGIILEKQGHISLAIDAYLEAMNLESKNLNSYAYLGGLYIKQGNIDKAIDIYKQSLEFASIGFRVSIFKKIANAYNILKNFYMESYYLGYAFYIEKKYFQVIPLFEKYLTKFPNQIDVYIQLISSYSLTNQSYLAIKLARTALNNFPNNFILERLNQSVLPIIYENKDEIVYYRQRFTDLLDNLINHFQCTSETQLNEAFESVTTSTNFYLGYQGNNDIAIMKQYCHYVKSIGQKLYPYLYQNIFLGKNIASQKIRIGLISLHLHSLGVLYLNWIKNANSEQYIFFVYDISGNNEDIENERWKFRENFKTYSHTMRYIFSDVVNIAKQILDDQLDILIFPDIGLDPKTIILSTMRLAPIQCSTWGQPMTSGSPNIDYFLGSDLMEPKNAYEHYSETLIRLPNLGFSINQPDVNHLEGNRYDYGINTNQIVYLCCQALYKYLPQHDYIFPTIALKIQSCKFIFFHSSLGTIITDYFKKRLGESFDEFGLDYREYCIFLEPLPPAKYLRIHQLSDIFLDCLTWSGGLTTKDAIACGLPIVTCPGKIMRARQSYGMLKMIGVTETIAENEADFIDKAVRLGLDQEWRQSVREKMLANRHRLFNDQSCIVALETFFEMAIQEKQHHDLTMEEQ